MKWCFSERESAMRMKSGGLKVLPEKFILRVAYNKRESDNIIYLCVQYASLLLRTPSGKLCW